VTKINIPNEKKISSARKAFHEKVAILINRMKSADGTQKGFCEFLKSNKVENVPNNEPHISRHFKDNGKQMSINVAFELSKYVSYLEECQAEVLNEFVAKINIIEQ